MSSSHYTSYLLKSRDMRCYSIDCTSLYATLKPMLLIVSMTSSLFALTRAAEGNLFALAHATEEIHDSGEDHEQDTTTGSQSQHLGCEALVQSAEALLAEHCAQGRERPVVLGHLAGDLGRVLDARLDDVHGGVQNGTDSATNGTGNQIVGDLALLVRGRGQQGADLENAAEVSSIPQDVAPQSGLETLVQRERTLLLDDLSNAVHHAVVFVGLRLVLEANLDQLEGNDDEGFGRTGSCASQNGQRLVHLLLAEQVAVEGAPRVVGSEFCSPVFVST